MQVHPSQVRLYMQRVKRFQLILGSVDENDIPASPLTEPAQSQDPLSPRDESPHAAWDVLDSMDGKLQEDSYNEPHTTDLDSARFWSWFCSAVEIIVCIQWQWAWGRREFCRYSCILIPSHTCWSTFTGGQSRMSAACKGVCGSIGLDCMDYVVMFTWSCLCSLKNLVKFLSNGLSSSSWHKTDKYIRISTP